MLATTLSLIALAMPGASAMTQAMEVKHALSSVPAGWQHKHAAADDAKLTLHVGLKETNLDKLQERLLEISDPYHGDYGKHMTRQEIEALTRPSDETISNVQAWLKSHGVTLDGPVNSGFLKIRATVEQANKMLDTTYGVFHNEARNRSSLRTTSYSVPVSLRNHITTIQPTTLFANMVMTPTEGALAARDNANVDTRAAGTCSNGVVTPACIRQSYNINYTPTSNKSLFGITGFLNEHASQSDLTKFLKSYGPSGSANGNFSVELINGGTTSDVGTTEADLDIQYTVGLTWPMKNVFLSTGGEPPYDPSQDNPDNGNEPYLDFLSYLATEDSIPQTISSSYADQELTVPQDYAETVCTQFMKLGARGTTFIAGSGDGGVSGAQETECHQKDGSIGFVPTFPSTCPWITSVGGTNPAPTESADTISTGGFSNYFPRPDYQAAAVKGYLATLGNTNQGLYNASGRGFPDVAAFSEGFRIILKGHDSPIGGTSAATPTFASVVALLNDYLLSQGKPTLGFLNPFLYSKGVAGLKDITRGHSYGCGTNGFSAVKGWDPITGLGTPNFGKLKTLV